MSKKPFSDPRWNQPLTGKIIGTFELTYEKEKRALDWFLSEKIVSKEEYDKELTELKEKYNIKD